MPHEPGLDEQVIEQIALAELSSKLDAADNIDIEIRTNLLKMIQGQAEAVSLLGQGLLMHNRIRVQTMELHTGRIAINLLSILFKGRLELNQPVDATADFVLTEQDINRALNLDDIKLQLPNLELSINGEPTTLETQQLQIHLPGHGKIVCSGNFLLHKRGKTRRVCFTAVVRPQIGNEHNLWLETFHCTEGQEISLELALALTKKVRELLKSPDFELEGMILRIKNLDVQEGRITLQAEAHISELPH